MSVVTDVLLAMVLISAVIYGGTRLWQWRVAQLSQWSSLWAVSLTLCVAVPGVRALLPLWPRHGDVAADGLLTLPIALDPIRLPPLVFWPDTQPLWVPEIGPLLWALSGLYVVGVGVSLLRLVMGRLRVWRIVTNANPMSAPHGTDVYVSSKLSSPFAWTPFGRPTRSRIVIPRRFIREMTGEQINQIIAHERAHLDRRDDEVGLILRSLLCLCWMSPFAHALFARWSLSTELCCDMVVNADRNLQMRRAYADTLLQALHIVAGRVRQYPAASFSPSRLRTEKMRINHIMTGTRPSFKRPYDTILLTLSALGVTAIGLLTLSPSASASAQTDQKPPADAPVAAQGPTLTNARPTLPNIRVVSTAAPLNTQVTNGLVTGRLTALYGKPHDPFQTDKPVTHRGIDIAAPMGTPIYAPASGIILAATDLYDGKPGYGKVVVLQTEGGVRTMVSHLQGYSVQSGQSVSQGDQIATVGSSGRSTGPHVHIETYRGDHRVDPMSVWPLTPQ